MNDASPARHDKFRAYRARKKAAGLREVRLWVPDIDDPKFRAKLAADMAIPSVLEDEQDATIFIEKLSDELWNER